MSYWRDATNFAWADTVSALHLNSPVGFMIWIATTLVVLAGLSFWGSADASNDELLTRAFLAAVALGAIPFVFAWNFINMPPKMHKDLRDWTKELEVAILGTENKDAAVAGISDRYQEGLALWRSSAPIEKLEEWESAFNQYIKANFSAGFYHQICVNERLDYMTIDDGRGRRTFETDKYDDRRVYYTEKLRNISSHIPHCDVYYKGEAISSLAFKVGSIRQFGLREHRLPQAG